MNWRLRLRLGDEAEQCLRDPGFLRDWQALAAVDAKQHWFQQPFFCVAWYAEYGRRYCPLLVTAEDTGGLRGVMPLATRQRQVVPAGAHQCEYQGWIAAPDIDVPFARAAVGAVLGGSREDRWVWRYVAPGIPEAWLDEPGCPAIGESFQAPLLRVDDKEFLAGRERGRLRSHRNRLLRRGLQYRRITAMPEATEVLRRLATWCDLRQAAAHATLPFSDDAAKLPFHQRLLEAPEQAWLSALYLGDMPIAAHMGFLHAGELAVGIQGYDPAESRSSPGALLLLDVASDLAAAGGQTLDLTPGGDPWKERFASHHRTVRSLVLHRTRASALAESAARGLRAGARRALAQVGADRFLRAVERPGLAPAAALDIVDATTLPAPTVVLSANAEVVEATLLQHASTAGADAAAPWLQEAFRRLGSGWRPAAGMEPSGAHVLIWAAPRDVGVDVADPAAPQLLEEPGDGEGLVVRADSLGGLPPRTDPAAVLTGALACWNESPRQLRVLSDAGARDLRAWLARQPRALPRAS